MDFAFHHRPVFMTIMDSDNSQKSLYGFIHAVFIVFVNGALKAQCTMGVYSWRIGLV